MGANRIVQTYGTTTSADEDIMAFLKTQTSLNNDTENNSFVLRSIYLTTGLNTNFKINDEPCYSNLEFKTVVCPNMAMTYGTGFYGTGTYSNVSYYKVEIPYNQVLVNKFIIAQSGITYFCRFVY